MSSFYEKWRWSYYSLSQSQLSSGHKVCHRKKRIDTWADICFVSDQYGSWCFLTVINKHVSRYSLWGDFIPGQHLNVQSASTLTFTLWPNQLHKRRDVKQIQNMPVNRFKFPQYQSSPVRVDSTKKLLMADSAYFDKCKSDTMLTIWAKITRSSSRSPQLNN